MTECVQYLDVNRAIQKLAKVYGKSVRKDELAPIWADVLRNVSRSAFEFAVSDWLASDAYYFPKPGQIRAKAIEIEGRRTPSKKNVSTIDDGPCPVCGAEIRLLTPEERGWKRLPVTPDDFEPIKRFGVLHDLDKHERAGVPAIDYGF